MRHRPPVSLLLLTLLISLVAAPARAQLPATPEARLQAVTHGLQRAIQVAGRPVDTSTIAARMAAIGVPAVSVAVIHDGRIDWARAWGLADVASSRPATPATLFQAASMSKPVAALGVLRLVDTGELDLDADVNDVLRGWRLPANQFTAQQPVTLRRLLSHTAGTTVHGFRGYAAGERVPSTTEVLDGTPPANSAPVRVDTVPGARWRYSGGGFTIAQAVVAERTGVPFAEFMRRRVLEPLGMQRSTYEQPLPDSLQPHAATGYRSGGEPVAGRFHAYPEMAAAGLWTTPSEYAQYVLGVMQSLRGDSGAILSRELAEAMLTQIQGGFGIGVGVAGSGDQLQFSHGGANEGFRSTFIAFPKRGAGVVVMTNSDDGAALAQEIVLAAARIYGWPGPRPRTVQPVPVAAEKLEDFVGLYQLEGLRLEVSRERDRLLLSEDGAAPLELVPTGTDVFVYLGGGMPLMFERDAAGKVVAIRGGSRRAPRIDTP